MPLYRYEAVDRTGKTVHGAMDAPDEASLARRLEQMGYALGRVVAPPAPPALPAHSQPASAPPAPARDMALFFRQMTTLAHSGISLYQAADELAARTAQPSVRRAASQMADSARAGGRVSDAMAAHPRLFPEHVVGAVRAGETGGFVEVALDEVARAYEETVEAARWAWVPRWLLVQAAAALVVGQAMLPALWPEPRWGLFLQVLFLRNIPIALALLAAGWLAYRWLCEPAQQEVRDRVLLRLPAFGDLARQRSLATFVRMLGRLYKAGLGPVAAWHGAMQAVPNAVIRTRLAEAYAVLEQGGRTLPDVFAETGLFANETEQLLATGVLSGQVVEMLDRIAAYYQANVERARRAAQFATVRVGCVGALVLGGALLIYLVRTYFARTFEWVDQFMAG